MKVRFDMYKEGGKWYSKGIVDMEGVENLFEAIPKARKLREAGYLPGLEPGCSGYHVVVTMMAGKSMDLSHLLTVEDKTIYLNPGIGIPKCVTKRCPECSKCKDVTS